MSNIVRFLTELMRKIPASVVLLVAEQILTKLRRRTSSAEPKTDAQDVDAGQPAATLDRGPDDGRA